MTIKFTVIEDQESWTSQILKRIRNYFGSTLEYVDIGLTTDSTYHKYISQIEEMLERPDIYLVDYNLGWKERSSGNNGEQTIIDIFKLYPDNKKPCRLFISGPYIREAERGAMKLLFKPYSTKVLALDKNEFDDPVDEIYKPYLQYALEQLIEFIKDRKFKLGGITYTDLLAYPDLNEIQLLDRALFYFNGVNKEYYTHEITNQNFLCAFVKTALYFEQTAFLLWENGEIIKYIQKLNGARKENKEYELREAGIKTRTFINFIYNPILFKEKTVKKSTRFEITQEDVRVKMSQRILFEKDLPMAQSEHPYFDALNFIIHN